MIIFFASSVASTSCQLREAIAIGFIGLYYSKDDRAILQAAALVGKKVLILNTLLTQLSISGFVLSSILIFDGRLVKVAQPLFWTDALLGIVVIFLDSIKPYSSLKE